MHRAIQIGALLSLVAISPQAVLQGVAQDRPVSASHLYTSTHPAMGTDFVLYQYSGAQEQADAVAADVFAEVDRIEDLLSNYRESSELSRINREAGEHTVTTDPETFRFLTESLRWSAASDGAFDITVGRLMKAWGFFRSSGRIPSAAELARLRSVVGWQKVELDGATRSVRFTSAGVELDPGGIGKGFAVDAAVAVLREHHVTAAMISAGSSTLYALGAPPGQPGWKVVVPGPLPSRETLTAIYLRDTSLSSADCSEKHFVLDGHDYCHIMDPLTMRPVQDRIQVSIISPSATASDALSNVIFVLPPQRSLVTLRRFAPDSRALIVTSGTAGPECSTFRWDAAVNSKHCASR